MPTIAKFSCRELEDAPAGFAGAAFGLGARRAFPALFGFAFLVSGDPSASRWELPPSLEYSVRWRCSHSQPIPGWGGSGRDSSVRHLLQEQAAERLDGPLGLAHALLEVPGEGFQAALL